MKRSSSIIGVVLLAVFGLSLFFSGCGKDNESGVRKAQEVAVSPDEPGKAARYKVYLITMDQGSNFWQQIDEGCKETVKEMGDIEYHWTAPNNHDAREQARCIDKAVKDGANAILLSAISTTELNDSLRLASQAGVKLVYVDSAASFDAVATLETDNVAAGKAAAAVMKKALDEKGITSGTIGIAAMSRNQNANERDRGFREGFEGTPFTLAPTVYVDNDRANVKNYVKEHLDYVGFFGSNGQTTFAIGDALRETGARPAFIAFDTADVTLAMIKDNIAYATLQQNPKRMGKDGVKIAVDALDGKITETNTMIDTGINIIRRSKI